MYRYSAHAGKAPRSPKVRDVPKVWKVRPVLPALLAILLLWAWQAQRAQERARRTQMATHILQRSGDVCVALTAQELTRVTVADWTGPVWNVDCMDTSGREIALLSWKTDVKGPAGEALMRIYRSGSAPVQDRAGSLTFSKIRSRAQQYLSDLQRATPYAGWPAGQERCVLSPQTLELRCRHNTHYAYVILDRRSGQLMFARYLYASGAPPRPRIAQSAREKRGSACRVPEE